MAPILHSGQRQSGPSNRAKAAPAIIFTADSLLALDPDTGKLKWHFHLRRTMNTI